MTLAIDISEDISRALQAKWGDVSVGPKIIDAGVKKRMKKASGYCPAK